jgi:hypothetical protein
MQFIATRRPMNLLPSLFHPSSACSPTARIAYIGQQNPSSAKQFCAVVPMFLMRTSARRIEIPYLQRIVRKTLNARWRGELIRKQNSALELGLKKSSRVPQGSSITFIQSNDPVLGCIVVRSAFSDPGRRNQHA